MAKKSNRTTCKVCRHPLCLEIEIQRLIHLKSLRDVETFCADNDFEVSYVSIKKHFDEHVDEQREVQVRYMYKKRTDKDLGVTGDEVQVKLKELDNIDSAIKEATDLMKLASQEIKRQLAIKIPRVSREKDDNGKETGTKFKYEKVEVSHSVVQLFKGATEEIRQSAKAKMEILGIDKKSKAKEADSTDSLIDAIMRLTDEE